MGRGILIIIVLVYFFSKKNIEKFIELPFLNNCSNITYENNTLSAKCTQLNKKKIETKLDISNCKSSVLNCQGKLTCDLCNNISNNRPIVCNDPNKGILKDGSCGICPPNEKRSPIGMCVPSS